MPKTADLLPGTLDMLILKAVSLKPLHGYGVLLRIQQISGDALEIPQGSLYPALYRLEHQGLIAAEWGESENKRQREVLHADRRRPAAAARRNGGVEPARDRDRRRAESHAGRGVAMLARLRSLVRRLLRSRSVRARDARRDAISHRGPRRRSRARAGLTPRGSPGGGPGSNSAGVDAVEGGLPSVARRCAVFDELGQDLRYAAAPDAKDARLHGRRRPLSCPRHRRQHRDLQLDGRGDPADAAGSRTPHELVFLAHGASRAEPASARTIRCSIAIGSSPASSAASPPSVRPAFKVEIERRTRRTSPGSGSAATSTSVLGVPMALGRGFSAES